MEKGEFLGKVREKSTTVTIKEFSAEGAKLSYNSAGEIKEGNISGKTIETTDIHFV